MDVDLCSRRRTWDDSLDALLPHVVNTWKNPDGFLTWLARSGFEGPGDPPKPKPKPKCSTCGSARGQGAVESNGTWVPCPDCSTPEWREKFARAFFGAKGQGA